MSSKQQAFNPWSKTLRHVGVLWGTLVGWLFSWVLINESDTSDDPEAGLVASAVGALVGLFYLAGKAIYDFCSGDAKEENSLLPKEDQNNPWNARLKAGVVCGEGIGRVVFSILPIPLAEKPLMLLGGAIGGVVGGIIALFIPWWNPSSDPNKAEANPASERIRSGAMFGSAIGIVFGVFVLTFFLPFGIPLCILFGAGLGAALGSLLGYLWDADNTTYTHDLKNPHIMPPSNPWSRRIKAGIQWGACLGILLGVLLPGLGIGLSLGLSVIVGGALLSIAGGLLSLAIEPLVAKLTTYLPGHDYRSANPWGPRCRFGVALGTSIGMFIGCLILPGPAGALAGGAIGGLIGGLVAVVGEPIYLACRGYYSDTTTSKQKKRIQDEDLTCKSGNQYSERCRTGVLIGAAIGALIGFLVFPPLGLYLGSAIGGILGGRIAFIIPADLKSVGSEKEDNKELGDSADSSDETDSDFEIDSSLSVNFNDEKQSTSQSSTGWQKEKDAGSIQQGDLTTQAVKFN